MPAKAELTLEDCQWCIGKALMYCKQRGIVDLNQIDDAVGVAELTMAECQPEYNRDLSSFRTYAGRCVWNRLNNHFRNINRIQHREKPLAVSGLI